MSKITDKTVKSKYPPKQTNVTWIDTSHKPTVTKSYINGKWVIVGGGGGGTKKYSDLEEKPSINGIELNGNKTSQDLGVYSKPSSGIPESDLSSDVQQALQKHFKGWYISSSTLPSNPVIGDYAYVKGAGATDPAAIYECTTAGSWSDSGRDVDTTYVQTFASGEEVNEVHIVNDLTTGGTEDVLSAEQGKVLSEAIDDVSKYKFGINPNRNWDDCAVGIGKYSNLYYVRAKGLGNNFDYVINYNTSPTGMIYKIAKSSSSIVSITTDNRMISTDDDCPISFDGTYQGGNHGWSFMTVLTMSEGSGISNLNIGQVWKDTNNNLYLVVAINTNENKVSVLGINSYTGTLTYPYFNNTAPVSPFTVVNPTGSSETYSFVSKTTSDQQFKKIKNKIDKSCWIDGIKITNDMLQNVSSSKTTWLCGDKYEYKHTYSLIKPDSFIEYLTQNVGTLASDYSVEDVGIAMTLDETYILGYGGALSIKSVISSCDKELVNFGWGQTQQGAGFGQTSVSANEQIIIPNHSTYYTPTNTPSTGVNLTYSSAIDEDLPLTRFYRFNNVQGSFTKGLCEGYNDTYGTGTIEQKKLQNSLARLETFKKWYPKAIGGNIENSNLPPYSVVASFAYKGGLDNYPLNPLFYWFDDETAYLLIESHSAQTATIKLPESLIGWNVSVETEFGDVDIKSKNVGKYGLKISTGSYGSAIIRITK